MRGVSLVPEINATTFSFAGSPPSSATSPKIPTTIAEGRSSITTARSSSHSAMTAASSSTISPATRGRRTTSFAKTPRAPKQHCCVTSRSQQPSFKAPFAAASPAKRRHRDLHEPRTPAVGESEETRAAPKWLAEVYRGDRVPQFTLRSLVMGRLLGGFMSLSNLYVGLKTGWGLGVTITACILALRDLLGPQGICRALRDQPLDPRKQRDASTASAAGYIGGTCSRRVPALYRAGAQTHRWPTLLGWRFSRRSASSWRSP